LGGPDLAHPHGVREGGPGVLDCGGLGLGLGVCLLLLGDGAEGLLHRGLDFGEGAGEPQAALSRGRSVAVPGVVGSDPDAGAGERVGGGGHLELAPCRGVGTDTLEAGSRDPQPRLSSPGLATCIIWLSREMAAPRSLASWMRWF
jgi:hypothetical protein